MPNPSNQFTISNAQSDDPLTHFEQQRDRHLRMEGINGEPNDVAERAICVLEAAALAGLTAWERLILSDELSALELTLVEPHQLLAGLEQQLFAPAETGLREQAVTRIEGLGHRYPGNARDVERLLHAAGEPKAAYRVEHERRQARGSNPPLREASRQHSPLVIAVAGGHPRLRKMMRRDLVGLGVVDFREIPPGFEASRGGRDVSEKLVGADLVVVIVRQISHSTSDQVIAAATRAGVNVAYSSSAGIAGVRHQVERYVEAQRGEP